MTDSTNSCNLCLENFENQSDYQKHMNTLHPTPSIAMSMVASKSVSIQDLVKNSNVQGILKVKGTTKIFKIKTIVVPKKKVQGPTKVVNLSELDLKSQRTVQGPAKVVNLSELDLKSQRTVLKRIPLPVSSIKQEPISHEPIHENLSESVQLPNDITIKEEPISMEEDSVQNPLEVEPSTSKITIESVQSLNPYVPKDSEPITITDDPINQSDSDIEVIDEPIKTTNLKTEANDDPLDCKPIFNRVELGELMYGHTHVYACYMCGQNFRTKDDYNRHLQTHKDFNSMKKCEVCQKQFQTFREYLDHKKNDHVSEKNAPLKMIECKMCKQKFSSYAEIEKHAKQWSIVIYHCYKYLTLKEITET